MLDGTNPEKLSPEERLIEFLIGIGRFKFHGNGRVMGFNRVTPYSTFFEKAWGENAGLLAHVYLKKALDLNARTSLKINTIIGATESESDILREMQILQGEDKSIQLFDYNKLSTKIRNKKVLLIASDTIEYMHTLNAQIQEIRRLEGLPIGCIILFDRQESAHTRYGELSEFAEKNNLAMHPLAGLNDIITYLQKILPTQRDDIRAETVINLENLLEHQLNYGLQLG